MDFCDPKLNEATKPEEIWSNVIIIQLEKPMVESCQYNY